MDEPMLNLLENRYARHRLPGATMTQAVADVLTLLDEVRRLRDGIAEHQSRRERCWCWQYGRCLTDCPTAGIPHPNPMTDENWKRAYRAVTEPALIGDDDE